MAENPLMKFAHLLPSQPTQNPAVEKVSDSQNQGLTNNPEPDTAVSIDANEKAAQTMLTPQAMQLLGAGKASDQGASGSEREGADADLNPQSLMASGSEELAAMNTESLEPKDKPATQLNVQAARLTESLILGSGDEVRSLCDRIDQLIESNENLVGPPLAILRNSVQSLMVTLKTRPEFDSVILDSDVRNVMKFIRATREEALGQREIKTEKKVIRSLKKEAKAKGLPAPGAMADAFNSVLAGFNFGGPKK